MRKAIKTILILLLVLLVLVGAYIAYAFLDYKRLEDNLPLEVTAGAVTPVEIGDTCRVVSYNIGFGAYSDDYSFFMDGGTESRARSPEAVDQNISGAMAAVLALKPDFLLAQEVDFDATRSHHIDERALVRQSFPGFASAFSQNYDSPYLLWPLHEPHGANKAGTMTLSRYGITSSLRRSLPIEKGFMMMVDLDRCYSVSRIPLDNGKELALYNFHLSAYTSDGKIAEEQLSLLFADMAGEVAKGNYVVAGGDFNKDLLGNAAEVFGVSCENSTWAKPIPPELIPDGFSIEAPFDDEDRIASCRNADSPYGPDSFRITVDGFIVSSNVEVVRSEVIDTGFRWSDHNPVYMDFKFS